MSRPALDSGASQSQDSPPKAVSGKKRLRALIQWLITLLVVLAVIWTGWKGYGDLSQQEVPWSRFHWHWFPVACLMYFFGMVPSWWYWHRILNRSGMQVSLRDSFRAFFMSQLGKYVPGKVMVILIRTSVLCHQDWHQEDVPHLKRQHHWVAVTATAFMETLTFIAMGGLVGVLAGAHFFQDRLWVVIIALLIAVGMTLPILPPVFHRLAGWLPLPGGDEGRQLLQRAWTWKTWLLGCFVMPLGWCLLGSSLWILLHVIPDQSVTAKDYPATLTCVSLANVLGFVSLIPGGFGVREVVMYPILNASGFSLGIVIVVLYRFSSLIAEAMAGAVAWCLPPGPRRVDSRESCV